MYLVDVEPVLDLETGKNKLQILRETEVYADLQDVGMEEHYSAAGSNISLIATYEIPSQAYHGEKYIITGDRKKQFEIFRVGKGRNLGYRRLPVKAVPRKNLLEGLISE